jgi:membrane protein
MGPRVGWRQFAKDLAREIKDDQVSSGAAALAFYLMLALFPAAIFGLSLLPYLPIPHLEQAIMDVLAQLMPGPSEQLFTTTVRNILSHRSGGVLSFGLLFTLWSASNGLYALMQQLNVTYGVRERRPFWKVRGIALLLMVLFFLLIVGSLGLVIFGGAAQSWLASHLGFSTPLLIAFGALRWVIILLALTFAFSLIYYLGPHIRQRFRFITAGSVFATAGVLVVSLAFRLYVANFANYDKTYGSLGAVIVLLMWLYLTGLVVLLGSEINALLEGYGRRGAHRGERDEPRGILHEQPA